MGKLVDVVKDAIQDLATLEVATLTNSAGVSLGVEELSVDQKKAKKEADSKVVKAIDNLVIAVSLPESTVAEKETKETKVAEARKVYKEVTRIKRDVYDAIGAYNPGKIFPKIKESLNDASVVAYSRFELDGDSINFISNNESHKNLIMQHKEFVSASKESRKELFDTVISSFKGLIWDKGE